MMLGYIMVWVVFAPVYLGEYKTEAACLAAREEIAQKSQSGTDVAISAMLAMSKQKERPPQDNHEAILCLPQGK